ncbi:A-kinase anchor protein 200 isoform X3 [Drosophila gunungcola]|uniref:A-kinase anchor protein 200 isoform X3 n=1 Tax=Drosophila gunungcola TaxID=103775 RepID=UPI0022E1CBA8|nr:A-kinase anchor protein 200 isoform X3 [Drosophila gunungcola]
MGKAQSKRSIDITTDPKKVGEGDEVAGKVEKIDVDQKTDAPAVNGDAATPKEGGDEAAATGEKKETEEHSENDKDLTTEKSAAAAEGGDAAAETAKGEEGSPKEGAAAAGEDITPLADESIKSKSKKDKVKKKWSFRSISFGKKDKQKPAKSEEAVSPTSGTTSPTTAEAEAAPAADAAPTEATNGEAEKTAETAAAEPTKETASKDEAKPAENGSASEQEKQANGEAEKASPAPTTVEEAAQPKPAEEPATTTATESNTAATTTATEEVPVKESQPEPEVVTNGHGAGDGEALTNGSSNGLAESPVAETAPAVDNIPSNVDDEQPHQNGTNGTTTPPPTPVAVETEKGQQIEVDLAKDLKEKNAAADVTTQEQLPVTCE